MENNNLGLIPIRNFAPLGNDLYRSAQPIEPYEYNWLKKVLNINTIVNLRIESRHDEKNAPSYGINVINIDVCDHKEPTLEQCKQFADIIKDKSNYPLLFHCEHGHGRTSTFCVLARLTEGMKFEEAINEETNKFHYEFKHPAQLDFLENNINYLQNLQQ